MIHPAIPVSLLALAAPAAAALLDSVRHLAPSQGIELAQLSIHERIIIRVPRMSMRPPLPTGRTAIPPQIDWRERKGPKCIAVADIAGAALGPPGAVDLMMDNGDRLRAKLDGDCAPLDYYPGFYLRPASDGKLCQDRDSIRMRSGARCEIDAFKTLRAKR